ncbi:MAG: hypothetical protein SRB2_02973 [Desulfobacteraceae bacterium Eth-SRB2]|nr:MAG: hypothetical protein SRB2_02973 [Desulfobacteraceae bacterium Eth-SRB2]
MLHYYCKQFLDYCHLADFLVRSIQALTNRLKQAAEARATHWGVKPE